MTLSIQPVLKTTYTDRGNEYKESNIGKYSAGAGVAVATAIYGGQYTFKGAKKLFGKAKTIKMEIPKFKKPDFEAVKQSTKKVTMTLKETNFKEFMKNIPQKITSYMKKGVELTKQGYNFVKTSAKKINMGNIKKAGKSIVDFVTSNAKKINMANVKKVSAPVVEFANKPSVKYGAGVAAGFAAVFALGAAADYIANKISAYKADKI